MHLATGAYVYVSPEARLEMAEAASRMILEAARIRRLVNASAPVMRLPNELLAEVFMLCAHSPWDDNKITRRSKFPRIRGMSRYRWLRLTHVCQHWREVALDTPKLWTDVEAADPELVRTLIARSKTQPLTVWIGGMRRHMPPVLWAPLFLVVHRIRTFDLHIGHEHDLISPFELPPRQTFSELRLLRIFSLWEILSFLPSLLLPPFEFPALRDLSITRFQYHTVQHLLVPSLTSLSLEGLGLEAVGDWWPLLGSLREMSKLEELTLEDAYPLPDNYKDIKSISDAPVRLPSLRTLRIQSRSVGVGTALLMQSLCFPGDAIVRVGEPIAPDMDSRQDEHLQPSPFADAICLLEALEARLSGNGTGDLTPHPPVLALTVSWVEDGMVEIAAWPTAMSLHWSAEGGMFTPARPDSQCFSVQWPLGSARIYAFLQSLDFAPSLLHAQSLFIPLPYSDDEWPIQERTETFLRLFEELHLLQRILTGGMASAPTLKALCCAHGPEEKRVLPSLQYLHLSGYSFNPRTADGGLIDEERRQGYDLLKAALTYRAQIGVPVHSLELSSCRGLESNMLEELRGLVAELIWDGCADY